MQSACALFIATLALSAFSSVVPSTYATRSAISSRKCKTPRLLQMPSSARSTPTRTSRQPGAGLKNGRSSSPLVVRRRRGPSTHLSSRTRCNLLKIRLRWPAYPSHFPEGQIVFRPRGGVNGRFGRAAGGRNSRCKASSTRSRSRGRPALLRGGRCQCPWSLQTANASLRRW